MASIDRSAIRVKQGAKLRDPHPYPRSAVLLALTADGPNLPSLPAWLGNMGCREPRQEFGTHPIIAVVSGPAAS